MHALGACVARARLAPRDDPMGGGDRNGLRRCHAVRRLWRSHGIGDPEGCGDPVSGGEPMGCGDIVAPSALSGGRAAQFCGGKMDMLDRMGRDSVLSLISRLASGVLVKVQGVVSRRPEVRSGGGCWLKTGAQGYRCGCLRRSRFRGPKPESAALLSGFGAT